MRQTDYPRWHQNKHGTVHIPVMLPATSGLAKKPNPANGLAAAEQPTHKRTILINME
jgi:hypothetical protein